MYKCVCVWVCVFVCIFFIVFLFLIFYPLLPVFLFFIYPAGPSTAKSEAFRQTAYTLPAEGLCLCHVYVYGLVCVCVRVFVRYVLSHFLYYV